MVTSVCPRGASYSLVHRCSPPPFHRPSEFRHLRFWRVRRWRDMRHPVMLALPLLIVRRPAWSAFAAWTPSAPSTCLQRYVQRDTKFNDNELHHRRATPQSKLHLQLLRTFITDNALHPSPPARQWAAILTTARPRYGVPMRQSLGSITGNHPAHCRVAQPDFLGNLGSLFYHAYALGIFIRYLIQQVIASCATTSKQHASCAITYLLILYFQTVKYTVNCFCWVSGEEFSGRNLIRQWNAFMGYFCKVPVRFVKIWFTLANITCNWTSNLTFLLSMTFFNKVKLIDNEKWASKGSCIGEEKLVEEFIDINGCQKVSKSLMHT